MLVPFRRVYRTATGLSPVAVGALLPLALLGALWLLLAAPVHAEQPESCFACHPAPGLATRIDAGQHTTPAAEAKRFKGAAHVNVACADCHPAAREVPHPAKMVPTECRHCHDEVGAHFVRDTEAGTTLPACVDCHGHHGIAGPDDPDSPVSRENVPDLCTRCHGGTLSSPFAYGESVHGKAHQRDHSSPAAVCTDCHGAHPEAAGDNILSTVSRAHLPQTCGKCHEAIYDTYRQSVHGKAAAAGEKEAAVCTDCHGEHDILSPRDPAATTSPSRVSATCASCHADAAVIRIRGLPADQVTSYEASYHGKANRWGDVAVANCTSCHGHHHILPASDPASQVHPDNVAATCGQCHPGSELKYTIGDVHLSQGSTSSRVVGWVRLIYLLLIAGTLGGTGGYIVFDLFAYFRARRRGDIARFEAELHRLPQPAKAALLRMSLSERGQHLILVVTFTILALTGFPLFAPESAFAKVVLTVCGGVGGRALVHRIAGAALCLTGLYHLGYLAVTRRGRGWARDMLPSRRDVANVWEAAKYLLGFSRQRPQFGRFGFPEKMEYVGVLWGTAVMGLTGFLLAAENLALRFFPKWAWDAARAVHGWEAILAVATIAIWHLYHVIWKPGVWPMSRAWLNGYITFHQLVEEHPAQYREIMGEAGVAGDDPSGEPAPPAP